MNTFQPRETCKSMSGSSPDDTALEIPKFGSAMNVQAPNDLAVLHEAISGFCDRRTEFVTNGQADPLMWQYHEIGATVATWLIYEGPLDLDFLTSMFKGSFYHKLCKVHFEDDRLYLAPDRINSRNLRPPYSNRAPLLFHQGSVEQDPRILRVLNCWIPLDSRTGVTVLGIKVIRHSGCPKFLAKGSGDGSAGFRGRRGDRFIPAAVTYDCSHSPKRSIDMGVDPSPAQEIQGQWQGCPQKV